MGSIGNQNPWAQYNNYRDCSQGICSIYCPQWCYIIFPPPPPFSLGDDDSGTDFSPLIIAVIGILASAFILVSYYTIISKYCRRRRGHGDGGMELNESGDQVPSETWHGSPGGLEEALIESITVCKYNKNDGFIEGTDCSVCLSEFQENENLRLLPKCNHAFHLPCIDTWLKSHASCPLCRASVTSHHILPNQASATVQESAPLTTTTTATALQYQHRISGAPILVIQDLERSVHQQETIVSIQEVEGRQQSTEAGDDGILPVIRRSVSMNISSSGQTHLTVSDILRITEDCVDDDRLTSHGEKNKNGVPSNISMKRSISTGRFMFTGYEKGKSSGNPHPA